MLNFRGVVHHYFHENPLLNSQMYCSFWDGGIFDTHGKGLSRKDGNSSVVREILTLIAVGGQSASF